MLMICTPCYGGMVSAMYLQSVLRMMDVMRENGVAAEIFTQAHESLIPRARNSMANDFLRRTQFSHLLFIDADIGFAADAPLRFMRADKAVVCGIYPVKHLDVAKLRALPRDLPDEAAVAAAQNYAVKLKAGARIGKDGLVEAEYGATGFMMIRRDALENMARAYPELAYDYAYSNDDSEGNFAFFDTHVDRETGEYLPEDYAFCRRHTAIGGAIYADIFSTFTHVGSFDFTGSFAAFLNNLGAGVERGEP